MLTRARITAVLSTSLIAATLSVGMAACSLPFGGPSSTGPTSVSKQISAAKGGTLTISTGATLSIPASALSGDATVTLTDPGKAKHANGDPLAYVSDMFTMSAKGSGGAAVSLKTPATISITPQTSAGQNLGDLIVAEVDPDQPGAIELHHAISPTSSSANTASAPHAAGAARRAVTTMPLPNDISYNYAVLNSSMWVVGVPSLTQKPKENAVLQVPWYWQDGLPWCVPTSLTEMLHYYDWKPTVGDPLESTFGGSKALANWQIAAKSAQPAGGEANYNELTPIGVPFVASSGGTGAVLYEWDDDFLVTLQGATGNFTDFETYVILVDTGLFSGGERKPLMLAIDQWNHSVVIVGVDGDNIYLHDSNGNIAENLTWTAFQQSAHGWYTDDQGKKQERHYLLTAVLYNYPVRPETQRRGSLVIGRNEIWTTDSVGNDLSVEWDGASPHSHGYYLNDPTTQFGTWLGTSDLGYTAERSIPLQYDYRIANVTNVPLTFKSTAELSGPNYGDNLVSYTDTTTVPPYSMSGYINGTLNEPATGTSAIFDVKLFETGNLNAVQDVKFVRYLVQDAHSPTVQITHPANGAHVYVGSDVGLTGSGSDPDSGHSLPNSNLTWSVDGSPVGWGPSTTTSFGSTGTYTVTLTGTNYAGKSGSASVTVVVDPAPPKASVQIVSPANGASFIVGETATSYPVNLIASGSTGMQFSWSSSIDGNLGSGANITANLTVQHQGNCATPTTHTITLQGQDNLGRTASASITINLDPSCIK